MANETKDTEKLKELEINIARELDQKVRLSEPTDPRLDGSVALNPSLVPKSAEPAAKSSGDFQKVPAKATEEVVTARKVDDITLDEVDSMLSEVDEEFGTVLTDIKSEVGQVKFQQGMESISIGSEYLKVTEEEEEEIKQKDEIQLENVEQVAISEEYYDVTKDPKAPPEAEKNFWNHLTSLSLSAALLPVEFTVTIFKQAMQLKSLPPSQVLTETLGAFNSVLQVRVNLVKEFFEYIGDYEKKTYLKVIILFLMLTGFYYLLKDITLNDRDNINKDPFLKTFDEVAQTKTEIQPPTQEGKEIPENVIRLSRVVSNLRAQSKRRSPMAAVELYIQTTEREAAIEIKLREKEVKDIIARTLEQFSYTELDSLEGKDKLKLKLSLAINKILNNGRIKEIYFNSFQMSQ
ncbi:MAG: flagellar basal body-associated FliL family protein [Oligoflexia bacterium]|nr:flagellar basal body-associated FliL family protein [Oligoflexia bacterium]